MRYIYEPWLDPGNAGDFCPPAPKGQATPLPSAHVTIYNERGEPVGKKAVYGILAYADSPKLVRLEVPKGLPARGYRAWRENLVPRIASVEARMAKLGYHLTPTNASWHVTMRGGALGVGVLFTKEYTNTAKAPHVGRLGSLLGKLTGGSYEIADVATLDGGDPDRSYYKTWDGVFFVKEGALDVAPSSRVIQLYGVQQPETYLAQAAVGQARPIIWGIGLVVPDKFWDVILEGCGIPGSCATVVASSREYIKFSKGASFPAPDFQLYCAREAFVAHRAKLTQEDRQLHQLTESALADIEMGRTLNALQIERAFRAFSAGDRAPLIEMVASYLDELYESARSVDAESLEEAEDLEVLFHSIQSVHAALYAGAPVYGGKIADLYCGLVNHRVKSLTMPGVTAYSFPSNVVGRDGLILLAECARKVKVGQGATDIRYPNTGTSMVPVVVRGFSPLPVVIADPVVGKSLQNEDYDGDVSVVVFSQLVEDRDWLPPVPKVKEIGDLDPQGQIVSGSFSKLCMGLVDFTLTDALLKGKSIRNLQSYRFRIQTVVDMAKKAVDTTVVEGTILKSDNQGVADPAGQIIRRKFKGLNGAATITRLVGQSRARSTRPMAIHRGAEQLPLIAITTGSREVDATSLDEEELFGKLEPFLGTRAEEDVKFLLHAYNAWLYVVGLSEDNNAEGYGYLKIARQWLLKDVDRAARALECLVYMNLCFVKNEQRFLALVNKSQAGRRFVAFNLTARNREYANAFATARKSGRKPFDCIHSIHIPRSFGCVTVWPAVIGRYDLREILTSLGYQHQYPLTIEG